jgi:hypothetical protein
MPQLVFCRTPRSLISAILAMIGLLLPAHAYAQGKEVLDNAAIISLVAAKVPEAAIFAKIDASRTSFDLSVSGIIALSKAGVNEKVMGSMQESVGRGGTPRGAAHRDVDYAVPTDYGIYFILDSLLQSIPASELQLFDYTDPHTKTKMRSMALAPGDVMRSIVVKPGVSLLVYSQDAASLQGIEVRQLEWVSEEQPVAEFKKLTPTRVSPVPGHALMVRIIPDGELPPGAYALHFPGRPNYFYAFLVGRGSPIMPDLTQQAERDARWNTSKTVKVPVAQAAALSAARRVLRGDDYRLATQDDSLTVTVTKPAYKGGGLFSLNDRRRFQVAVRTVNTDSTGTTLQVIGTVYGSGVPGVKVTDRNAATLPQREDPGASRDLVDDIAKEIRKKVSDH